LTGQKLVPYAPRTPFEAQRAVTIGWLIATTWGWR